MAAANRVPFLNRIPFQLLSRFFLRHWITTVTLSLITSGTAIAIANDAAIVINNTAIANDARTTALRTALSWEDCVRTAAQNNPELKAAAAGLRQSRAQRRSAFGAFFPQLTATTSYRHSERDRNLTGFTQVDGIGASFLNPVSSGESYSATLSVTQNVFNGFADLAALEQASANITSSLTQVDIVRARVSTELKTAFANMRFSLRSIELAKDILARRRRNLDFVQLRFEGGRENKGSLLLSRAYLNQAKLDQLEAANALLTARTQLAQALGQDTSRPLEISGSVPTQVPPLVIDFEQIAKNTPEVRQAIAQVNVSQASVGIARGRLWPSLDLVSSVGRLGETWFPDDGAWSIGVEISLPLFTGGRNYFDLQATRADLSATTFNKSDLLRRQTVTLRQTYATYVEATEREKVDRSFLEAARTRAEIARSKYNNGLLSFDEWDIIENDLISREKAFLQSQRDRVIAEANWERSQGKGVFR